jgi:hypothetical protein
MPDTIAPVLPLTPRATRVRRPNRRPGSVPPLDTSFAAIAASFVRIGADPDSLRSLATLDPAGKDHFDQLATLMEQQARTPALAGSR